MARLLVLVESLLATVVLGGSDEARSSVDEERRRAGVEEALVKIFHIVTKELAWWWHATFDGTRLCRCRRSMDWRWRRGRL